MADELPKLLVVTEDDVTFWTAIWDDEEGDYISATDEIYYDPNEAIKELEQLIDLDDMMEEPPKMDNILVVLIITVLMGYLFYLVWKMFDERKR